MDAEYDSAQTLINSLKIFISWCENTIKERDIATQYLIKIDGRYVESVNFPEEHKDDEYRLNGIQFAIRFNKNLAHRTKYFLDNENDFNHEIVNLRTELLELIKNKTNFLSVVERAPSTN